MRSWRCSQADGPDACTHVCSCDNINQEICQWDHCRLDTLITYVVSFSALVQMDIRAGFRMPPNTCLDWFPAKDNLTNNLAKSTMELLVLTRMGTLCGFILMSCEPFWLWQKDATDAYSFRVMQLVSRTTPNTNSIFIARRIESSADDTRESDDDTYDNQVFQMPL